MSKFPIFAFVLLQACSLIQSSDAFSATPKPSMAWKRIGKANDLTLEECLKEYNTCEYEYGAVFNNANILPCTINSWNGDTRYLSVSTPYLQGNDGGEMWWGSSVNARSTKDEMTTNAKKECGAPAFTHTYVDIGCENAEFGYGRGWQSDREFIMYVRPFAYPWEKVGKITTMEEYEALTKEYPFDKYEWGTNHNGHAIKEITVSRWSRGLRFYTKYPYPQGDDVTNMKMGVSCWTVGTDDEESQKGKLYHRYILAYNGRAWGTNEYKPLPLYVRKLGDSW